MNCLVKLCCHIGTPGLGHIMGFVKVCLKTLKFEWHASNNIKWAISLFVFSKLILQMCMHSHPEGLDVQFLVGPFVSFHISCMRTAKALARLRGCTASPGSSLVAYVISTIISWASSNGDSIPNQSVFLNTNIKSTDIKNGMFEIQMNHAVSKENALC